MKQEFVNIRVRREDWEQLRLMSEIFGCRLWKTFGHVVSLALSAISATGSVPEGVSLIPSVKSHGKADKRNCGGSR